jgi:aminomethyltransferase
MTQTLKRTRLYQWHVDHGARMGAFAGWELPVQYPTGPLEEHHTTRHAAGLFDIDHMAQIDVRGPDAEDFVNWLITYDVRRMELFDAHYAMMCYADGGVVDDLFVYKLPDRSDEAGRPYFFLVVNAANHEKDVAWIESHAGDFDVQVRDLSDETYMLALQGPMALEILDRLTRLNLEEVPRFTAVTDTLFEEVPVLMGRTGYTGEDGFELFFPAEYALKVWEGILEAGQAQGVKPIGLAARDSLRFEPCMPLYGQELAPDITPVEARLSFAVSFDKDFIGRQALLEQKREGPEHVLVGFEMVDKGVPRHGYAVAENGSGVGEVTSGMFSPTMERYLGMALVPREFSAPDTEIKIIIRDKAKEAKIVKRPFYVPAYRR